MPDGFRQDLADLTVIDLTSMIAGPTCSRLFAELGANVIHVEPPAGDDGRNTTTAFLGREGVFHSVANRSKRGMTVDYTTAAGREVIYRLVDQADLFVENTRPGMLDDLGLGYADLSLRNPRLVYVSISGWGRRGPLASSPGYDVLIQAFSGAMVFPPGTDEPVFSAALVGDPTSPLIAAFAAMVALRNRETTGRGAHVTTSLLQGALHLLGTTNLFPERDEGHVAKGRPGLPGGSGVFATNDGQRSVVCAWTDAQYRRLCGLAGVPHLGEDPAYATRLQRQRAAIELNEVFAAWASGLSQPELLGTLQEAGIPCSPVHRGMAPLLGHEHAVANDLFLAVDHPDLGVLWEAGTGFEIDGQRGDVRRAPKQGEHTGEVLAEFGFSAGERAALFDGGVVR
jgi:crotonobetainyl-CoA:carnitine CoA-transferase CaiB-like acyl-CoA transferase